MEKKINLIPSDMAVPASAVRLTKTINNVSLFLLVFLIFSIISAGVYIYFLSTNLAKVEKNVRTLTSEVRILEGSEQKLVLMKDRLAKIGKVRSGLSIASDLKNFQTVNSFITANPDNQLDAVSFDGIKTTLSIKSKDSPTLINLLSQFYKLTNFKSIIMSGLTYNVDSYLTGFTLYK